LTNTIFIGVTEKDLAIESHVHGVGTNYTGTVYKPAHSLRRYKHAFIKKQHDYSLAQVICNLQILPEV
jgi:hypothetical protein